MNFKKIVITLISLFTFSFFNNLQAQSCIGTATLTSTSGTFDDGSAPTLDYQNNQNCEWLIQPTGATIIRLSFNRFDTEDCCDAVSIYDGANTTAPLLGTFKGTTIPPIVTSTGGALFVIFTTDGSITSTGWEASYLSTTGLCFNNLSITANTGTVEDGSGTMNYQNNLNCSWIIEPIRATSITATFNSFDVNNLGDTLFLYDGVNSSAPLLGSFTGTTMPTPVTSTGGKMYVEFVTNGATTSSGWEFSYTSVISPTCTGLTTLTSPSGIITDGSLSGTYDNNLNCTWLIQPSNSPTVINFDLNLLDLATGFPGDEIKIYDGTSSSGGFLRTFTGTSTGGTVTAYSGAMFIEFTTDATKQGQGWEATYNSSTSYCVPQTTFTADRGDFKDGSPSGQNYLNHTDCEWLIQPADPNLAVKINFYQIDTELGNDTITIYDGPTTASPIITTLSGSISTVTNLLSTGNSMLVTFKTNGIQTGGGWRAIYTTQLLPTCNGTTTLTAASGKFNDGSVAAADYAPDMNCSWLIQPTGASFVHLDFNRFDTQVNFDSLTVYDGPNNSSPILGSYSGNTIPAAISSSGNSLFLEFKSNATQNATGWDISYTSTNSQCFNNLSLFTASGTVSDGSGAMNYQNNLNCSWVIEPPKATSVTATFNSFNIDNSGDTLFIYDGPNSASPLLGKFTGNTLPTAITATSGVMYVNFITDGSGITSGWDFNYTSIIPLSCSGLTTLTALSGTITDGSLGNNYDNNLSCSWLIQPPGNLPFITFDMTKLDLPLSSSPKDEVLVYDGINNTAPLIGAYYGKNLRSTIIAYSGSMYIEFNTNAAVTSQGWEATYNAYNSYCSPQTTFTAYRGNFTDGSPAFQNYLDNTNCSWLIQPANPNKAVNLTLGAFNTELGNDTVTVYDGATTTDPILGTFSGTYTTNPKVLSTGGSMLVTFKTNGSTTATGWLALYEEQQIPACVGTTNLTAASGTFDDGTLPTIDYAPNLNCSWLIQPAGASLVSLNFNRFDVQNNFDFIKVYDGTSNAAPLIGTYTGTTIPSVINSTGPDMFVEFTTNNSVNATGWEATYSGTNSQCFANVPLFTNTGTVSDGSGAMNYQNNLNCSWSIAPPLATTITATFNNFAVSPGDSLYFYDGNSSSATLLGAFSGTTLPATITSTVGSLFVEFVTDGTTNTAGWEFNYTATFSVSCAGTTTFTSQTMTFTDGSAKNSNYDNNLNCSWLIQPTGNPSIISFTMNRLDLGLVFGDRVRVYDGTSSAGMIIRSYTGTNFAGTVLAYSGAIYVEFVTNGSNTATGWEATYTATTGFCIPNLTYTANNGFFDDGSSFGQNYLDNSNCDYLIQPTTPNVAVKLNFLTFDTESGHDTVTVYDGAAASTPILATFSGNSIPPTVVSSGGSMFLTFKSNATINAAGWRADYSTQPRPSCSGRTSLTAVTDTFTDGSLSGVNYVENSSCQWLINPTGASLVYLKFNRFATQANTDFVTVYDGPNTSSPVIGTYSGSSIPPPITSTGSSLLVKFTADYRTNLNGFEANYTSSTITGIGESSFDNTLSIYPNPTKGGLTIVLTDQNIDNKQFAAKVYSIVGKEIPVSLDFKSANKININLQGQADGIYFIMMKYNDRVITKKISLIK
jgi:cubilin